MGGAGGPRPPLDWKEMERWRSEAALNRDGALRDRAAEAHSLACFRAEQAAQLAAKGLLRAVGAPAWGHDLTVLAAALRERLGPDLWPPRLDTIARRLSLHYTASRYPDAFPEGTASRHYDREAADRALADAEVLMAAVEGAWTALTRAEDTR